MPFSQCCFHKMKKTKFANIHAKNNSIIVGKFASFFKLLLVLYLIIYYKLFKICKTYRDCTELQGILVYNDGSKAAATSKMKLVVTIVISGWQL